MTASILIALLTACPALGQVAGGGITASEEAEVDLVVKTAADSGPGSLRQAILDANAGPGADAITFDPEVFGDPQTITLGSELPELTGVLTIDGFIPDRLWSATGVTVSGGRRFPVFRVARGARVTLLHLTVAEGCGVLGGGVSNLGDLAVRGVTFVDNEAAEDGGAISNLGGAVTVVNSTFASNRAGLRGGGLAGLAGFEVVTNCTFSGNSAATGGGLFSEGDLLLSNTILADSDEGGDCVASGVHPGSTHNLIEQGEGCGAPISSADPRLGSLGGFNGPTMTIPLGGGSPAINLGDNASAVDEYGLPLVWDQRGNGDPRFVAGYTDIGAFEHQRFPDLTVDTPEDNGLRGCSRAGRGDCPLRGAIELANATPEPDVITFDRGVFGEGGTLVLDLPLPAVTAPLTLDAGDAGVVEVRLSDGTVALPVAPGVEVVLVGVTLPIDQVTR